jgi:hypothetical protein
MRLVSIPFCRVPRSAERLGRTATAASEVSTTYRPVPPPVVAPPLPSPIVPPSADPEPVGDEGLGRSAVPSLAHPPAKSISPRLMAASDSGAVLPRMFRHVRVIDGLLRDIQKPGVECPLIVYTDLDTSLCKILGEGACRRSGTQARACRTYSTVAAITPNNLYFIGKKEVPVSPHSVLISQPISHCRRNRHFVATVEWITAPISIIFGTNCQGQMGKGKLG